MTIVFTDVQGSTALWEDAPGAMKQALELHNAVFRRVMADFAGYEVKTVGDAFMIAFDSAQRAINCCARLQTELLAAPWPAELLAQPVALAEPGANGEPLFAGLRVRMGMHTGEPQCRADPMTGRMDYFGPMVNRAARVAGVAHGGQVLMSADAFAALDAPLAPLVATELGSFKLKGLAEPEQLIQVLPPSLTGRLFAPPKATPAIANAPAVEDDNEHFITMLQSDMPALDAHGAMHRKVEEEAVTRSIARPVEMALELDTTQRDAARALEAEAAAQEAEAKKQPRSLKPLWIAATLVFIGALCFGGYQMLNQPTVLPEKPPTLSQIGEAAEKLVQQAEKAAASLPVQTPPKGMLRVMTKPSDAEIFVDGKLIGESPLGLDNTFAEGEHQLVAKKKKWVATATFKGGEDVRLELKLTPLGKKPKKKR